MHTGLILPCYRESARLPHFLEDLCTAMERINGVQVLVVDDGSGAAECDATRAAVETMRARHPCLLPMLELPLNIGKGGAVYAGWNDCAGCEWLGFVDADGSVPADEVVRLIELARGESNPPRALFASRVKMLGHKIDRQLKRHLLGRIYATLVSELLNVPVYDSQCGLKLVPAAAWRKIKPALTVTGFAFDAQLLLALRHSGCEVIEVPIDWHETPGGKIRLVRDAMTMTRDVLAIRKQSRTAAWRRRLGLES